MICGGKVCGKELKGGFKQSDGTFRCAACVVHESEMNTNLKSFQDIIDLCDSILKGPKYSRPSKKHIIKIKLQATSVIAIREMLK